MPHAPLAPEWGDDIHAPLDPVEPVPEPEPPIRVKQLSWTCTGVMRVGLKKTAKPHDLPYGTQPRNPQPTADAAGKYLYVYCDDCHAETVWRKGTLL